MKSMRCNRSTSRLLPGPCWRLLLSILLMALWLTPTATRAQDHHGWRSYGGDTHNSHYSALSRINRDNVEHLQPVWRYASARGARLPATSELQVNPIVIDGVLYGRNPLYNVFALDAATGRELWSFNPQITHVGLSNMRGLTYWQAPANARQEEPPARPRVFFTTGHFLMALDAATGKPVEAFGRAGKVDLREGLDRDPQTISINAPSPGVVFESLIIVGSAVTETAGAAPGDIRAYDVRTGETRWTFRTIPKSGDYGADTWPAGARAYAGGANAWAGMSLDASRGVVYVPTGSPTPDFDGSARHGDNLFANSVIALDARSGKRLWHFQAVRHDLWDRDLSSAPTLVTVRDGDTQRDLLAQASKQGVLYLLDRDTGEPVFPLADVAVPASAIPGELAATTQVQVTLPEPFTRQAFRESDLSNITPATRAYVKKLFDQAQDFAYLRPPGLQPSILFPGFYGGANWGGGAFDPETNLYYINAMEIPHLVRMEAIEVDKGSNFGVGEYVFRKQCSGCHGLDLQGFYPYAPALKDIADTLSRADAQRAVVEGKGRMMPFAHLPRHELDAVIDYLFAKSAGSLPQTAAPENAATETAFVFAGYNEFVDERYYPAIKPPWGTLTAIDLADGKRVWQVPLGEYAELTKEGISPTGTRNYGGPVVTAGGLLIIAATSDEMLRIFDKQSGALLWQYQLPAGGYATPATYAIDDRQFIVVTASGGKLGTPTGDAYIAFALPRPADKP